MVPIGRMNCERDHFFASEPPISRPLLRASRAAHEHLPLSCAHCIEFSSGTDYELQQFGLTISAIREAV
jgi:hypothetical protein